MSALHVSRLSEIAELNPVLQDRLAPGDSVAFVPMASVDATAGRVTSIGQRPYSDVSKGYTPMLSGDLLVAKITPCFENGKIAQAMLPVRYGFGSTEFHVVRPHPDRVDDRYLLHYLRLQRVRAEGEKRMTGSAGQRRVPQAFLADLPVPVPTLVEQRRIAAILDQANALRTQRRAALALLDDLRASIFLSMFGSPASPNFALGPIRNDAEASSGKSSKGVLATQRTEFPIYGGNGINGWATRPLYKEPVLVFGRVGQQCGNAFLTNGPAWITDNAIVVRIKNAKSVHPRFVLDAFSHTDFARRVRHLDLPFINQSMILDTPVVLPPIALQIQYVDRMAQVDGLSATHRASLAHLDALFASLQHRAFRGEL